jgi:hypothetical protein
MLVMMIRLLVTLSALSSGRLSNYLDTLVWGGRKICSPWLVCCSKVASASFPDLSINYHPLNLYLLKSGNDRAKSYLNCIVISVG